MNILIEISIKINKLKIIIMSRPKPKGSGLTPGSRQRNKGGKIKKG